MSRTILLADDSVTIQKVIELTFMEEDYEVAAAGDGDEAMERLEELRPDFVIADVHMPGASGIDVCRRSKQLYPEVPVLLLVGTFEAFDEAEARAAGANAHLKKPFDSQELLQLVADLMGPEDLATPVAGDPVADEPAAAEAEEGGDSTWGFDLAGEAEEPPGEPEWAATTPTAEPEWAVPVAEPDWAAASEEPEEQVEPAETAETGDDEPAWGPLDRQPAEVTPPAVGQMEAGEPVWNRPDRRDLEPEPVPREPFQLGELEPRPAGSDEVFDLGSETPSESEPETTPDAGAEPSSDAAYPSDPGWGFGVGAQEPDGEPAAPARAGTEDGETDSESAAAGFRWDETEEPGSLVSPPEVASPDPAFDVEAESEPAAAAGELPSWSEPEEAGEPAATSGWDEPELAAAGPAEEPPWPEPIAARPAEESSWPEATGAAEPPGQEPPSPEPAESESADPLPAETAEPAEGEPTETAEPGAEAADPAPEAVPGSGASYGGVEVSTPAAGPAEPAGLTESDVERIARRVAELVGERVTREVAWEVVPDLAEVVIRERLRELEGQID